MCFNIEKKSFAYSISCSRICIMKFTLFKKHNTDFKQLQKQVNENIIRTAYKKRFKEIESLRQYDRGEKVISTSHIKARLQRI